MAQGGRNREKETTMKCEFCDKDAKTTSDGGKYQVCRKCAGIRRIVNGGRPRSAYWVLLLGAAWGMLMVKLFVEMR